MPDFSAFFCGAIVAVSVYWKGWERNRSMVKKEKLSQFYFTQYREGTARYRKKNQDGKAGYAKRAKSLSIELQRIRSGHVKEAKLEDYHRQVRNLCYFAFKQNNQVAIMQIRDFLLPELVRLDLAAMKPSEQEIVTERFLDYLRNEMNGELCVRTLKDLTVSYAEYGIREQIIDLVPLKPETEFPKASVSVRSPRNPPRFFAPETTEVETQPFTVMVLFSPITDSISPIIPPPLPFTPLSVSVAFV